VIGLFAANLDCGRTVAHRAEDPFAMCSTFKTYASARVLQMVERGELSLDQTVFVDPGDPRDTSPPEALGGGYRNLLVRRRSWRAATPATRGLDAGQPDVEHVGRTPPGWTSADKTGRGSYGSTNDIGMVYGPQGSGCCSRY
jgi:beta-lactamase class A